MRRLVVLIATAYFLVFLPILSFSALPPFWTQSQRLSLGTTLSSEVDACSLEDNIYIVWSDNRTGNKEIFYRSSYDAGLTWSREERLTDTPDESIQPAIACDKKNIYIVWREKSDETSQIYFKKFDGESWGNSILLSDKDGISRRPDITSTTIFPGSYLYLSWESIEAKNSKSTAYLTRSVDGGRIFSAPQPVAAGIWDTREPVLWGGARDAYLAWSDNREGAWNIFFKRLGEAQSGIEAKLSSFPDCGSPAICGAEPHIYTTWQCTEKDAFYADVYVSQSMDYGATWSGAEKLTNGEAESMFPRIAILDEVPKHNLPWVFWQDGRNGEWQIWMLDAEYWTLEAEDRPSGIKNLAQFLTDTDKPSISPCAISTAGQIHLFWVRVENNLQANIIYMRRDNLPPRRPGIPVHFDLTANPGYDDDKRIDFSWEASEPKGLVKYNIYASADNKDFALVGNTDNNSYTLSGESGKVYRAYVEAIDAVGNKSIPSEISQKVICDPDPPEVAIHSPRSDSTIRGDIPVIISVHDTNLQESNVEYRMTASSSAWQKLAGTFNKEMDRERIVTWDTLNLDGIYVLRLTASDKAGNESKAESVIYIDSRPPVFISADKSTQLTGSDVEWIYGTPAWSPDSSKIVFYSDSGGAVDIWVMSYNGSNPLRLTRNTAIERHPEWSPSGDMLVFQSAVITDKSPLQWHIWVIQADGKGAKQITFGENSDMNPSWSPDGSSIAFDSDRDGNSDIWLITNIKKVLTGAEPQLVKLTDNKWEDKDPQWSPDGSKIVFQSDRNGTWDLFEIGFDGTNLNEILATQADEIEPDWSPDKKWILFSTNGGDHYEIRAINWPERSRIITISPSYTDAHNAQWSHKMDSIAYESRGSLYSTALVSAIQNLEAEISWPRGGEILTGNVDIEGIARGKNFKQYRLQFFDPRTSEFQLIGGESTSQVPETGFLGRWNTEELEGEYLLKLLVNGKDGEQIEDSVRVVISNRLPFITIDEPQDGAITSKSVITVNGHSEQEAILTLNSGAISLSSDGSFSQKIQLSEGSNKIVIKARSQSGQIKEYTVERNVVLDTKPPEIVIESPKDFQVVHVPYITIKGRVNEKAEVSVLSTRVWIDENGNFQRSINIKEGINLISIAASDKLGHYSSILLRVIFQKETEIASDTSAPGITDVFPDNRSVVSGRDFQILATIIDDTGLDPFSLTFSFDNKEIVGKDTDWTKGLSPLLTLDIEMPDSSEIISMDQYPVIHLTFRPEVPVSEGVHQFRIGIEDTANNLTGYSSVFSVDTKPPQAIVSAFLAEDKIRVVAVANKPLTGISSASVILQGQSGYSILFTQKEGYYEAFLKISPSQKNFVINFTANTYLGEDISAYGYIAWDTVRPGGSVNLGAKNNPQFSSNFINSRAGKITLTLRSQDGLDANILGDQQEDAEYRRLQPLGLVYILSVSDRQVQGSPKQEDLRGIISLPIPSQPGVKPQNAVMFHWDDNLREWRPLDKINTDNAFLISSSIAESGIYTLFVDVEQPVISNVSPISAGEVPLDKFFVEAKVSDRGSGISQIQFIVDGKQSNYDYDPANELLTYFPSEIEWGLHKMEIIAIDRAGNRAEFSSEFITRSIFQFIETRVYPNPAAIDVNIEFKLTKLSDVQLRIYTITGEIVYDSEKKSIAQGKFVWNCRNTYGNKVANGLYIYLLEATIYNTSTHKKGVIAVVR